MGDALLLRDRLLLRSHLLLPAGRGRRQNRAVRALLLRCLLLLRRSLFLTSSGSTLLAGQPAPLPRRERRLGSLRRGIGGLCLGDALLLRDRLLLRSHLLLRTGRGRRRRRAVSALLLRRLLLLCYRLLLPGILSGCSGRLFTP